MKLFRYRAYLCIVLFLVIISIEFVIRMNQKNEVRNVAQTVRLIINRENGFIDTYLFARRLEDIEKLKIVSCSRLIRETPTPTVLFDWGLNDNCLHKKDHLQNVIFYDYYSQKWSYYFWPVANNRYAQVRLIAWALTLTALLVFLVYIKLKRRQKKLIDEAKEQIKSQISHDIRSPLIVLKSILDKQSIENPELQKTGSHSIKRIESMLDELIGSSDTRTSGQALLNEILEQSIREKTIEDPSVLIEFNNSSFPSIAIEINEDILSRIISNLFNNSIEANCTRIDVQIEAREGNVVLAIRDDGEGFLAENISKFGTQFSTKSKYRGLGISGAKKYLVSQKGDISIDKDNSKGTKILLTLPTIKPRALCSTVFSGNCANVQIGANVPMAATQFIANQGFMINDAKNAHFQIATSVEDFTTNGQKIWIVPAITKSVLEYAHSSNVVAATLADLLHTQFLLINRIILFEDDKYVAHYWKTSAEHFSIPIVHYQIFEDNVLNLLNPTPGDFIFIDKNFGPYDGVSIANQCYDKGWKEIWLQTGENLTMENVPYFIKGVTKKNFPLHHS